MTTTPHPATPAGPVAAGPAAADRRPPSGTARPTSARRLPALLNALPLLVSGLSLLYGVLGVLWLLGIGSYPFGPVPPEGDELSLLSNLPDRIGAGAVAVLGFLGAVAAVAHRRTEWSPSAYRPLLAFTAVQAVVFGLLAPDVTLVMVSGYLLVVLGLPVALLLLAAGALRQRTTRLLLDGLVVLVVAVDLATGLFDWGAFRHLAEGLATVPAKIGTRPLFVLGSFLLGCGWAALGVRGLRAAKARCLNCGRPGARWTQPDAARRWGTWAAVVAALCPLPYGLLRMTWLLPDPIGFSAAELAAEPGIRLFGVGLGVIAIASGLLTLGLIRPWGEVWPRWIPFLAGRPVPVMAAVVPGGVAAALLLVGTGALPQLVDPDGSTLSDLGHLLLFPFPLWGTAVALATAAYYYRRRGRCQTCDRR